MRQPIQTHLDRLSESIHASLSAIAHEEKMEDAVADYRLQLFKLLIYYLNNRGDIPHVVLLDLYLTARGLYQIILQAQTFDSLASNIEDFLGIREDVLLDEALDYCYTNTSAHELCREVGKLIFLRPVENSLFNKARTKGRDDAWKDIFTLESELPPFHLFFRTNANTIENYQEILEFAIMHLKQGRSKLETIWYGVDHYKNGNRYYVLPKKYLTILKQRTATFKKLVEYTERLDYFARNAKDTNIYERFQALRETLRRNATHSFRSALEPIHKELEDFSAWWERVRNSPNGKNIHTKILKLPGMERVFRDIAVGKCVAQTGETLQTILGCDETKALMHHLSNQVDPRIANEVLDEWGLKISEELNIFPKRINQAEYSLHEILFSFIRKNESILSDSHFSYAQIRLFKDLIPYWHRVMNSSGEAFIFENHEKLKLHKIYPNEEELPGFISVLIYLAHEIRCHKNSRKIITLKFLFAEKLKLIQDVLKHALNPDWINCFSSKVVSLLLALLIFLEEKELCNQLVRLYAMKFESIHLFAAWEVKNQSLFSEILAKDKDQEIILHQNNDAKLLYVLYHKARSHKDKKLIYAFIIKRFSALNLVEMASFNFWDLIIVALQKNKIASAALLSLSDMICKKIVTQENISKKWNVKIAIELLKNIIKVLDCPENIIILINKVKSAESIHPFIKNKKFFMASKNELLKLIDFSRERIKTLIQNNPDFETSAEIDNFLGETVVRESYLVCC